MNIFPQESRETFSRNYPEVGHKIIHNLDKHPLLTLEALAKLADLLPMKDRECNTGDLPLGVDAVPEQMIEDLGQRVLGIADANCWIALRHIEQVPEYDALINELLDELRDPIVSTTGEVFNVEGYIFVTSPGGIAPYHFDPEHNLLLQVRGSKTFTMFPAGDSRYAPDELHEAYHTGGRPELPWRDELADGGAEFALGPGDALFVPVMSPHHVRNGAEVAVSLSITWRSEWSFAEADARAFNGLLRKAGVSPSKPGRWPKQNRAKSLAWRTLRKVGAVD